eukprot:10296864-Heterocapsa_arctica.AAC.1
MLTALRGSPSPAEDRAAWASLARTHAARARRCPRRTQWRTPATGRAAARTSRSWTPILRPPSPRLLPNRWCGPQQAAWRRGATMWGPTAAGAATRSMLVATSVWLPCAMCTSMAYRSRGATSIWVQMWVSAALARIARATACRFSVSTLMCEPGLKIN